jgi:hypothetical protein
MKRRTNARTHEVGAPLSASTPKQVDAADQLRAPTTEPQRKGSEAEVAELLFKRTSDERRPPETTALHALTVLTGATSEGTHRQVTFRGQSDESDTSTVEPENRNSADVD